jgi:hypothetical protein
MELAASMAGEGGAPVDASHQTSAGHDGAGQGGRRGLQLAEVVGDAWRELDVWDGGNQRRAAGGAEEVGGELVVEEVEEVAGARPDGWIRTRSVERWI